MNRRGEGSNTAIVAIVVLVLVGIFAFFLMNGNVGDDSDVNVDMSKPAEAVGDAAKGMGEAAQGAGDAAKEAAPGTQP